MKAKTLDFKQIQENKYCAELFEELYICIRVLDNAYIVYLQNTNKPKEYQQHIIIDVITKDAKTFDEVIKQCQEYTNKLFDELKGEKNE